MKIGRIIIYSLTICFVVFLVIFMIGLHLASTRPLPPPVQEYLNGHVSAELYFEDQGAWGSYVALEISGLDESAEETISIRAEDCKPTLDSIIGKDVYISYRDFPSKNKNLQLHEVLLGEALLRQYSLKYTYHFTNLKSINE